MHEEYGIPKACSRLSTCDGSRCLHPKGKEITARLSGNYVSRQDIKQNIELGKLEDKEILRLLNVTPQA